jgi:hypothetical protein
MKLDSGFLQAIPEPMEVSLVIGIGKEASCAVMTALDDMVRAVGDVQA